MSFATRLFVGNLPENINQDALRHEFSAYGDVTNLDVKTKPGAENDKKTFAFITISASNYNVETCIKDFSDKDFYGQKLYVTRARESFLERLQREREQAQTNSPNKNVPENIIPIQKPDARIARNVNHKRTFNEDDAFDDQEEKHKKETKGPDSMFNATGWEENQNKVSKFNATSWEEKQNKRQVSEFNATSWEEKQNKKQDSKFNTTSWEEKQNNISKKKNLDSYKSQPPYNNLKNVLPQDGDKKFDADRKRLESIKRKRQEFMEKKKMIKTGFTSIDKPANKKVIFSDTEEDIGNHGNQTLNHDVNTLKRKVNLFDNAESGSESDGETNFNMKKQFEGKKGQKVLELQSRYKADKRFTLDERFVENGQSENEEDDHEAVDLEQIDERSKQLDILQNVLGVSIKTRTSDVRDKTKMKPGMLRFDPNHPDHMKFLAPVEQKSESKKSKKKNKGLQDETPETVQPVVEKVEVSKDQFYKVSDTLKEAITQPKEFSLRSLFAKDNANDEEPSQSADYIPIVTNKEKKVRNPLDPGEKNPFVYDSSDSENEEEKKVDKATDHKKAEPKIVWKEKLFFVNNDERLTDGLLFFTKKGDNEAPKDRRELKSIMKKRIYNKERKNNMFKKKIGGRKKTMKKSFRKKS